MRQTESIKKVWALIEIDKRELLLRENIHTFHTKFCQLINSVTKYAKCVTHRSNLGRANAAGCGIFVTEGHGLPQPWTSKYSICTDSQDKMRRVF